MSVLDTSTQIANGHTVVTSDWSLEATADNAIATATKAAVTGKDHYVSLIAASFNADIIKELNIKSDGVVIFKTFVHKAECVAFPTPLKVKGAMEISLEASGALATLGSVNAVGFTA